jgi:HK97 family phage portal protein
LSLSNSGTGSALNEINYFTCLRIIAESIAKLPLIVRQDTDKGTIDAKDHYLYDLLRLRPNDCMNAVDTIKTWIILSKHYGMAGLYINRKGSKVVGLYPVRIVSMIIDNQGIIKSTKNNKILYEFESVNGEYGSCFEQDILILKGFTHDGINAMSIKNTLAESIDTSLKAQSYQNNLFSDGLVNKICVQLTSDIKSEDELKKIQDKFSRIYSNKNRIFTVPAGYNVNALNLSLTDAQFAELKGMSKADIASAFGVPLSKLNEKNNTAQANYQDNLAFLTDTLQVIISQIEQEMDWKLLTAADRAKGYKIRAKVEVMLRLDAKTQAEVVTTFTKNGIYDLDYARAIVGSPLLGGEPIITFPSGQVTLNQMLTGQTSYITNASNADSSVGGGDNLDN